MKMQSGSGGRGQNRKFFTTDFAFPGADLVGSFAERTSSFLEKSHDQ
jgi:hypothetical protein